MASLLLAIQQFLTSLIDTLNADGLGFFLRVKEYSLDLYVSWSE